MKAFTLVELLVVVSIIALLIAILLPSLSKARRQAKLVVCTTNLKQLGTGFMTYSSEYGGRLPGPCFPGLYRNQSLSVYVDDHGYSVDAAKDLQRRQLTYLLRSVFTDKSNSKTGITDQVATCPTLAGIVPDSHFERYGDAEHWVFPTHYALNNVGANDVEEGGAVGKRRVTSPGDYWGLSPHPSSSVKPTAPRALASIRRASDEWAIADAWYRPRTNANAPYLQQDGPYQWSYSGMVLPNFAPHMRRGASSYNYVSVTQRTLDSSKICSSKSDGITPTVFFDAHAAPVKSKTAKINGGPIFYGYPGTVNPWFDPDDARSTFYKKSWGWIEWE